MIGGKIFSWFHFSRCFLGWSGSRVVSLFFSDDFIAFHVDFPNFVVAKKRFICSKTYKKLKRVTTFASCCT